MTRTAPLPANGARDARVLRRHGRIPARASTAARRYVQAAAADPQTSGLEESPPHVQHVAADNRSPRCRARRRTGTSALDADEAVEPAHGNRPPPPRSEVRAPTLTPARASSLNASSCIRPFAIAMTRSRTRNDGDDRRAEDRASLFIAHTVPTSRVPFCVPSSFVPFIPSLSLPSPRLSRRSRRRSCRPSCGHVVVSAGAAARKPRPRRRLEDGSL